MLVIGYGQDAGDDGNGNSAGFALVAKTQEVFVVVEKLRDDDIGSAVHFSLEIFEIAFGARGFRVGVAVATDNYTEMGKLGADKLDEFVAVGKASGSGFEGPIAVGSISRDCHDVADPLFRCLLEVGAELVYPRTDTGGVGGEGYARKRSNEG